MEDFLDTVWFKIMDLVHYIGDLLDLIFSPLNSIGPAFTIFTIAFVTVIITKFLTKIFKTKRYQKLQTEFEYWYGVRQEALKCEDPEKAKLLARNIDQARLNEVYYDYFLEGFLSSLATRCLPIVSFLAYVNEAYKPGNLQMFFGRKYIFKFKDLNGGEIVIGSVFWFLISILLIYLGWFIIKRLFLKFMKGKNVALLGEEHSSA